MLLIPVLDLAGGQAVHARRGDRAHYRPVRSVLVPGRPGDALALARAYRAELRASHCYVADVDAIEGRPLQAGLLAALADPVQGFGAGLMVDAGINSAARAREVLRHGATQVVVGLESLPGFAVLEDIVGAAPSGRVVFSLDLRAGRPVAGEGFDPDLAPAELAVRAVELGAAAVLVLDLAAVGSSAGPWHLELLRTLKQRLGRPVYAAGGVRSREDLELLRETGCDGVLVATAIHAGELGPADFAEG
ncbi:MAG TPA: HisA/HisF-related TIM barrel protein [Gemmatimonadales bacterium]|jgi:phosphoribosylformimino-5-aminoimidazole carboxamide ribotide isomerase|nr:HisA/HisF-related TIM barrel protein [Gemmatimonadales bacterium]